MGRGRGEGEDGERGESLIEGVRVIDLMDSPGPRSNSILNSGSLGKLKIGKSNDSKPEYI